MQAITTYKFQLDTTSKKFTCPSCGQKRCVRYLNNETGELFPDHVARCDRENECGYHYTPKQYLTDTGAGYVPGIIKKELPTVEEKIDFMPMDYVHQSMASYDESHFAFYLISLFGSSIARNVLQKYFVGRSRNHNGKSNIYWRIDKERNVRTGKIMCYNPETGKRIKEITPTWVHTKLLNFNYRLCFFGEHLLNEYPDKAVGIVESEKTAIIASLYMPDMVWLATGGNSGCKWREYSVYSALLNRTIILFPDFGFFNKKSGKTCFEEWTERANHIQQRIACNITVSKVLENNLSEEERSNDYDLADMLIKRDNDKGWALSDYVYPVMWDIITQQSIQI